MASGIPIRARAKFDISAARSENDGSPVKFSMVAHSGENPLRLPGWKFPVVIDLQGLKIGSQRRPINLNFDKQMGIGHTETIAVRDGSLVAGGKISRNTEASRELLASAKNGFPWMAAVLVSPDQVEHIRAGEQGVANGKTFDGPVTIARKSTLAEISIVDLSEDHSTRLSVAARASDSERDDLEATRSAIKDLIDRARGKGPDSSRYVGNTAVTGIATTLLCAREKQRREAIDAVNHRIEASCLAGPHGRRPVE